jgi:hypothetical protein
MFSLALVSVLLVSSDAPETAEDWLARADAPRQAYIGSVVQVRATQSTADAPDVVHHLELAIGDAQRQVVRFTDARDQGKKFLLRGDRSWLLVPGTRHPIPISPNQRMLGNIAYADIARVQWARDYTGRLRAAAEPCADDAAHSEALCQVVDITARASHVPYAAGSLWIDARGLAVRALFVLASGKAARAVRLHYRRADERWLLARMEIDDLLSGAAVRRTTLEYLDYRPTTFDDRVFDPEYALHH